jgi:hypothetical protein
MITFSGIEKRTQKVLFFISRVQPTHTAGFIECSGKNQPPELSWLPVSLSGTDKPSS